MSSRRQRLNRSQWEHVIDQQRQSDEPARAWCAANEVGYASFMKWRKQLRHERDDASVVPSPPLFIELTEPMPAPGAASGSGWLVEIDLPAGVQIRIVRSA